MPSITFTAKTFASLKNQMQEFLAETRVEVTITGKLPDSVDLDIVRVDQLQLSPRQVGALHDGGFNTLLDLVSKGSRQLRWTPGIAWKTIKNIKEQLRDYGVTISEHGTGEKDNG